ncbi:MAG: tyrosine-protein phosphatase [Vicinamibacteria bacterium]|jgi:protein tyrosine phosphatase (PTP) superfamily phosphohydrolase (DUF442 family)|nr:tyrosine-protein phosphatase [Vicinamibacteria bacterium]
MMSRFVRVKSGLFTIVVGVSAVLIAACSTKPLASASSPVPATAPWRMAERLPQVKGVENMGRVAPQIYRGATPTMEGLDALKAMGIKTVINLRHYHGSREQRACRERGLDYVRIGLPSSDAPRDEDVRLFLVVVTDPRRQPVFFHCWRGKDRTGAMCAIYRMAIEDWPLAEAVAEMQAYGFFEGWQDIRSYVDSFPSRRALVWPGSIAQPKQDSK